MDDLTDNYKHGMNAILDSRDTRRFLKVGERYNIPMGDKIEYGSAKLEPFSIGEMDALKYNMRFYMEGKDDYMVQKGDYTRMFIDGKLYMSDTWMEFTTNMEFLEHARGNILIGGLGMGMVLHNLTKKFHNQEIQNVTIVENNEDVIALIEPYFNDIQPKIIHGDIYNYSTDKIFDTIYFDIWDSTCGDNYEQMVELEGKFFNNLKEGGWMGCWNSDECEQLYFDYRNETESIQGFIRRLEATKKFKGGIAKD